MLLEEYLKGIIQSLPECPGCYQYLDDNGTIIYVGKAKNLKRRVSSYFNREHDSLKTRMLVSKIRDIKYIVVKTEEDALLLENNLIKQWSPKYNILLKDGKTYPSICISKEYFPKIFQTRKIIKGLGEYYGPYSSQAQLQNILTLIKNLYPLRRCHERITEESISTGKHKTCLEYHIKNCMGPCCGLQTHDEYIKYINQAREIIKGNTVEVEQALLSEMNNLAAELKFEEAAKLKKRYDLITNYRSKSEVVSNTINNVDVFNIEKDGEIAYINYLHVVKGSITQAFTMEMKRKLDETIEELLLMGIVELRKRYCSDSKEIVIPFHVEQFTENLTVTVPQKGDKKRLLELSKLNVIQYKKDRQNQSDKLNPEQRQVKLMQELKNTLCLENLPYRIECFDNSNISGSDAVAGCVVFEKCKPCKKEYRTYNIKSVEGPDDYASMQEVVRRRYTRIITEGKTLPDLIITDGGKGQMECVREVICDELGLNIPIAGLAKDDKHRTHELLYGFPQQVVNMKPDSQLFRLLTQIQDEVHRFAISFHRNKRSKRQTESLLDQIDGVGQKTKETLLKTYKTLKRIMDLSKDELSATIGPAKANLIYNKIHN